LCPAGVYLCSVNDDIRNDSYDIQEEIFDGSQELAHDLLLHLNGRDPYIVGAANIGKSTLTDRLIDNIIAEHAISTSKPRKRKLTQKEKKQSRFGTKSNAEKDQKRYETLQKSRVTRSSLPGTTLQNIRVPCFPDHTRALWDTPGLLLDPSLSHYPIRDFRRIKAMKPMRIRPQWHEVERKSFAVLVLESSSLCKSDDNDDEEEEDDDGPLPLLRIEIRLKKKKQAMNDPEPVHLVWNSTLNDILTTNIVSIEESHSAEKKRMKAMEQTKQEAREEGEKESESPPTAVARTPEEQARYKKHKRRQYEERKKEQMAALGQEKYNDLQKHEQQQNQRDRQKRPAALEMVSEDVIPAGSAREIDIEHFGSLGIVSPSTEALVRVFAPNKGIRPVCHSPMVVPPQWEDYLMEGVDESENNMTTLMMERKNRGLSVQEEEGWNNLESDEEEWGHLSWDDNHDLGSYTQDRDNNLSNDDRHWTEFSGEKVGWKFYDKPQYHRGALVDGWQEMKDE